jgi:hypothetical protein
VGTLSWVPTLRTRRARCLRWWISASPTTVSEVALTLILMDTYITLMIYMDHSIRLPLTRSESIELTTIKTLLWLSHLCLLLQVRLGGYIVNSCDFYSYRLIGKLTAFLQFQEFSLRNMNVASSTSAAQLSLHSSKPKLAWLSLRLQLYVLRLI